MLEYEWSLFRLVGRARVTGKTTGVKNERKPRENKRDLKQATCTSATETRTSTKKSFNVRNNRCACAL